MKNAALLIAVLCALTACSEEYGDSDAYGPVEEYGAADNYGEGQRYHPQGVAQHGYADQGQARQSSAAGKGELALHPFYDPKTGMVSVKMPFPADWQVHHQKPQGAPSITGPKGLKIFDFPGQSFVFTQDPQMQQMYYQSGQRMRPMPDIRTLIQQDIVPWAQQQGMRVVRTFDLPEVGQKDQWYQSQLYQSVPSQRQSMAVGVDLEGRDGSPFFLLMHVGRSDGNGMQHWFYYSNGLMAEKSYFDAAKKHLVYGLANAQYNPAQIQAYNQREAQKSGQSWASHNQRMRNNQANFEASQRAIVGANNSVNDSIMQGWRDRNAMQDRGQEQYIDAMTGRETMVDPSSGQSWKVDSGANNYWMNQQGEYFGTDDYNYNPNADAGMYDQDWQQLEE
jgi:hypothetical protein